MFDINVYLKDISIIFNDKNIDEINPSYIFTRNTNSNTDIVINEGRVLKQEEQKTLRIMNAIKFEEKISGFIDEEEDKNLLTNSEFKRLSSDNFTNHEKLLDLVTWKKEMNTEVKVKN